VPTGRRDPHSGVVTGRSVRTGPTATSVSCPPTESTPRRIVIVRYIMLHVVNGNDAGTRRRARSPRRHRSSPRKRRSLVAMTVRNATPDDLASIQAFLRAYLDEFWDRPYPRPEFSPEYLATGKVVVAEEAGHVIGMAKGVLHQGCGHVSFIYMRPGKRGRGSGRALLRALCEWFAAEDVAAVTVGVDASNPDGLAFWERLGFREFHRELTTAIDALRRRL
jgi:L-amino acid N-acyltransferase